MDSKRNFVDRIPFQEFLRGQNFAAILKNYAVFPRGGQEKDKAWTQSPATELTEFRGAAKRRTRDRFDGGQGLDTAELRGARRGTQSSATEPRRRGQEEDKAWTQCSQRVDRTWTEPGEAKRSKCDKRRTRPGHRAQPWSWQSSGARLRGGQEEHKAQPQSPATELTEFRGTAKRSWEEGHRSSPRVWGRGQEEDKRDKSGQGPSPATELTAFSRVQGQGR